MSNAFTPEAAFVARNWATVWEIMRATDDLSDQMDGMLVSLQGDLGKLEWWSEEWSFTHHCSGQVYISRRSWVPDEDSDPWVWIGVERFLPEAAFGPKKPPELYVWMAYKKQALVVDLLATLGDGEGPGEPDLRPGNMYVVRQAVQKCLPDGVDEYPLKARDQIMAFLDHYARIAEVWEPIIQRHMKAGGEC